MSFIRTRKLKRLQQMEEGGGAQKKKPRDLEPLVFEVPAEDKTLMLEIRDDGRTMVDWVNGHAKLKVWESVVALAQHLLWEWWGRGVLTCGDAWLVGWCASFVNTTKNLFSGLGTERGGSLRGRVCEMWGPDLLAPSSPPPLLPSLSLPPTLGAPFFLGCASHPL